MTEVEEQTEFKFSELSDKAKDKARDEYRGEGYLDYDWWDNVCDDAVRMSVLMGINISTTTRTWINPQGVNRSRKDIDIQFSGFSSQGDGACFQGNYRYVPGAVEKVKAEANDEELVRIAEALTLLQTTRRLQGLGPFSATISTSGRYSHSWTMNVEVNSEDEDDNHNEVSEELEDDVTQLMRDFADWIYKSLEDEYDYLMSDECVDQYLEDDDTLYDEEGSTI